MRFTSIAFSASTRVLMVKLQTPNADVDGWIPHQHGPGKFEPGDRFRAALVALNNVCARTHEQITAGGSFTPNETPSQIANRRSDRPSRDPAITWDAHPIEARKVHFYRKDNSQLVQVMITGFRSITGGGFSLPGVKIYLHPSPDQPGEELESHVYLYPGETKKVEELRAATLAMLPGFIEHLSGESEPVQGQLALSANGDGSAPAEFEITDQHGEVAGVATVETVEIQPGPGGFFDEQTQVLAEQMASAITDYQGRMLQSIAGILEADGAEAPEQHGYKGHPKRAVASLLKAQLLRNQGGRLHLTESGWSVAQVLRLREAAEA